MRAIRSYRGLASIVVLAIFAAAPTCVRAQTALNVQDEGAERTYLNDSNGKLTVTDNVFSQWVVAAAANWKLKTVDFLTNVCYGGGFVDQLGTALGAAKVGYTAASASQYNAPAFSYDGKVTNNLPNPPGDPRFASTYFENFTAAWTEGQAAGGISMLDSFNAAYSNPGAPAPLISNADKSSTGNTSVTNTALVTETPSYQSSAGNDADKLNPNNGLDEWAILICAGVPDNTTFRHDINLDRVYNNLLANGVPANQIEVLYPNAAIANPNGANGYARSAEDNNDGVPVTPATPTPAMTGLPATPVGNTTAAVQNALSMNNNYFGKQPTANSQLFVYVTGHAGHVSSIPYGQTGFYDPNDGEALGVRYQVPIAIPGGGGFSVPGQPSYKSASGSQSDFPDNTEGLPSSLLSPDSLAAGAATDDAVELICTKTIDPASNDHPVMVRINGGLDADAVMALPAAGTPAPVYDPSALLGGAPLGGYTIYTLFFKPSVFVPLFDSPSQDHIVIDISGVTGDEYVGSLLYGVDIIGGDQNYLVVVAPEPTMLSALAVASAAMLGRRRRRAAA